MIVTMFSLSSSSIAQSISFTSHHILKFRVLTNHHVPCINKQRVCAHRHNMLVRGCSPGTPISVLRTIKQSTHRRVIKGSQGIPDKFICFCGTQKRCLLDHSEADPESACLLFIVILFSSIVCFFADQAHYQDSYHLTNICLRFIILIHIHERSTTCLPLLRACEYLK